MGSWEKSISSLLVLWLIFSFTGCSRSPEVTVDASIPISRTASASIPKITITTTSTQTVIPTDTSKPRISPSVTHASSVTPTSLPTLSPDKINAQVANLLQDNGGCHLPCWWGLVPGQTDWDEALKFLSRFDSNIYIAGKTEDLKVANVEIPVSEDISSIGEVRVDIVVRERIVYLIEAHEFEKALPYRLSPFLNAYGVPDEIWINTYKSYPGEKLPFVISLYYPDKGIIAIYSSYAKIVKGKILACLESGASLRLWSSSGYIAFSEAAKQFNWDIEGLPYYRIENVTDLNTETFYKTYSDPNVSPCLKTPAELWPDG